VSYNPDNWNGKGPLPMLYSRTATGAVNTWACWVRGESVIVEWGQQDGTLQLAEFVCKPKNEGRSNATTAKEQARLEAIAKWRKQIKKKYYEKLEEAENGPKLRPMLAKDFKKQKKVQYPVDVQRKFDGVRCLAYWDGDRVELHSRGGDLYDVEHIRAEIQRFLRPGCMLDGELYVHGLSRQQITSLVKRPQDYSRSITYNVYDFVNLQDNDRWVMRKHLLQEWFEQAQEVNLQDFIVETQTFEALDEADIKALHDEFVAEGYEGAIVRLRNGEYRIGYRSPDLLKYKMFDDGEFKLTGYKTGKGKFKEVPIFECTMKNGKTFDVAPRGTTAVRKELLRTAKSLMGKMYTVRYFGFTDEGLPCFPVGIGVREKGT